MSLLRNVLTYMGLGPDDDYDNGYRYTGPPRRSAGDDIEVVPDGEPVVQPTGRDKPGRGDRSARSDRRAAGSSRGEAAARSDTGRADPATRGDTRNAAARSAPNGSSPARPAAGGAGGAGGAAATGSAPSRPSARSSAGSPNSGASSAAQSRARAAAKAAQAAGTPGSAPSPSATAPSATPARAGGTTTSGPAARAAAVAAPAGSGSGARVQAGVPAGSGATAPSGGGSVAAGTGGGAATVARAAPEAAPAQLRPASDRPLRAVPPEPGTQADLVQPENGIRVRAVTAREEAEMQERSRADNGRVEEPVVARPRLLSPTSFSDAKTLADDYKALVPVVLNLQGVEREVARRLIDFASGICYALDGSMEKLAAQVFLLTPRSVVVSDEDRRRLEERDYGR